MGSLLTNFSSLELMIRLVLQSLPNAKELGLAYGEDPFSLPVGTDLVESEVTTFDSLNRLIKNFNRQAKVLRLPEIDESIIEIRDAFAHGRLIKTTELDTEDFRLVKFSKPEGGRVRVVFSQLLSEEWFSMQRRRVLVPLKNLAEYHQQQIQTKVNSTTN